MRRRKDKPLTVSYLRVSSIDQDTEKNKHDVRAYANKNDFGRVKFIEEKISGKKSWKDRKIKQIIDDLQKGDRLIVPELSRLGRSTLEVLEILKEAKDKNIAIYSVKENYQLNGDGVTSKMMSTMLALFADLEHDFISMRTKEGLAAARRKGKLLGRPKGPGKSKLDEYREEIIALLKTGSRQTYIAKKYGCTPATVTNWLKKNKINVKEEY